MFQAQQQFTEFVPQNYVTGQQVYSTSPLPARHRLTATSSTRHHKYKRIYLIATLS